MKNYLVLLIACFILTNTQAQKFSAISQGYFSVEGDVKVLTVDSSEMIMKYDSSSFDPDEIPEVFYLVNSSGGKVEYDPTEIIRIEIPRGETPESDLEIIDLDDDDDDDDDDEYEEYNVIESTEQTKMLIYERVEIDHKKGESIKSKYREDYYLLQLASVGLGDRLRIYHCPNFEEGTEIAPVGELVEELSRNRVDYDEFQRFYYVKVGDAPAFRISNESFMELTPIIFGDCRPFRRKYSVKKELDSERTKKRGKTARKDVGKKKKKASLMRYPEFAQLVVEYHTLYKVMEEENERKRQEREAAKKKKN